MEQEKATTQPAPVQPVATPPQQPTQPQVVIHKSNHAPLIGAIVFLALVIGAAAVYLGLQNNNSQTSILPTPAVTSPTVIPSPSSIPTQSPQLKVFTSEKMKDLSFSGFSISYPPDWVEKQTKNELTNTVTLTKDANEIKIHQGPMGGNQCVFEGEMPDGPANDYRDTKYTEIKADSILLRRLDSPSKTPTIYSFCSNSPQSASSFGVPTIFGVITYTVNSPTEALLTEMDSILMTLKPTP